MDLRRTAARSASAVETGSARFLPRFTVRAHLGDLSKGLENGAHRSLVRRFGEHADEQLVFFCAPGVESWCEARKATVGSAAGGTPTRTRRFAFGRFHLQRVLRLRGEEPERLSLDRTRARRRARACVFAADRARSRACACCAAARPPSRPRHGWSTSKTRSRDGCHSASRGSR